MAENLLYILGAGASCKCFPLSQSKKNEKNEVIWQGLGDTLTHYDQTGVNGKLTRTTAQKISDNYIRAIKELGENASNFQDIDTYAKLLNLTGKKEDLNRLKQSISHYFMLEQFIKESRDYRYKNWLISICNQNEFPDNVKVLSWNYDFQMELASTILGDVEGYTGGSNSELEYKTPFIKHFPSTSRKEKMSNFDPSNNKPSLIHLNGIAGFHYKNNGEYFSGLIEMTDQIIKGNKDYILNIFQTTQNNEPTIHFSWEETEYHKQLLEVVNSSINDTTILVIIGYSFPFYNRKMDKTIFDILKEANKLKKIYFQDPARNGQELRSKFEIASIIPIEHIPDCEKFHIPFEY